MKLDDRYERGKGFETKIPATYDARATLRGQSEPWESRSMKEDILNHSAQVTPIGPPGRTYHHQRSKTP